MRWRRSSDPGCPVNAAGAPTRGLRGWLGIGTAGAAGLAIGWTLAAEPGRLPGAWGHLIRGADPPLVRLARAVAMTIDATWPAGALATLAAVAQAGIRRRPGPNLRAGAGGRALRGAGFALAATLALQVPRGIGHWWRAEALASPRFGWAVTGMLPQVVGAAVVLAWVRRGLIEPAPDRDAGPPLLDRWGWCAGSYFLLAAGKAITWEVWAQANEIPGLVWAMNRLDSLPMPARSTLHQQRRPISRRVVGQASNLEFGGTDRDSGHSCWRHGLMLIRLPASRARRVAGRPGVRPDPQVVPGGSADA